MTKINFIDTEKNIILTINDQYKHLLGVNNGDVITLDDDKYKVIRKELEFEGVFCIDINIVLIPEYIN